jgi:hypothetical protein
LGFVAVLRAESTAAPVVAVVEPDTDVDPGLIVVVAE